MAFERPELEELLGPDVAYESQGTVVLEGRDSGNVRWALGWGLALVIRA